MEYHLRVSINKADVSGFLTEFTNWKTAKIDKMIVAFESKDRADDSDKLNNPHIHCHIQYDKSKVPTKQSMSAFMKKFKHLNTHDGPMYNHTECEKNPIHSKSYVIKDGDIVFIKGYTSEEIEQIEQFKNKVQQDMKAASFTKLANRIRENKEIYGKADAKLIMKEIYKIYTLEFKTELPLSRCKSLAYQVMLELGYMDKLFEDHIFDY